MVATPASHYVILVMSPASYRAGSFTSAALGIGLDLVFAINRPKGVDHYNASEITIDFHNPDAAVSQIIDFVRGREPGSKAVAILAIDDHGALIAAQASAAIGVPHNDPASALAARDKFVMRSKLEAGDVPVPTYRRFPANIDPETIVRDITYPCVVKPLLLSGSRGVIRANTTEECVAAFHRTAAIIDGSGMPLDENFILIEQYVPGFEVALEGLLTDGQLQTLALFDKPDPLVGPYFEETIYVTPSRLPADIQLAISERTSRAASAIGLRHGPIHAELRIDLDSGDIWLIELAGRSIGGLCSSVLEFGANIRLEELILRHAASMPIESTERNDGAAGVMMIPIPKGGIFRQVEGIDEARMIPDVTGIEITASLNQPIVPLPEGESYLGFIFARGTTPPTVEAALRKAHSCLTFRIDPIIPLQKVDISINTESR